MKLQKTIKNEGRIRGRGLFGGKEAKVVFRSAPTNSGLTFVRTDVAEPVRINAVASNLAERSRRTTIKKGSVSIETIEHCLAVVSALEIDNLVVEVNGPELPATDCSCLSRTSAGKSMLSASRLLLPPVMPAFTPCLIQIMG